MPLHAQNGATPSATLTAQATAARQKKSLIESYRRQDWTGRGTFHRLGMLEDQETSLSLAAGANVQNPAATAAERNAWAFLSEILSLQVNSKSMFFGSDNIFNTDTARESDGQYAQFLGVLLAAQFGEHWKLATTFDQAWFFHFKKEHASSDFATSTAKQTLSYDHFIFNNKASISIPLSWQHSDLFNRQSGARTLSTWQYGAGLEFSWFPTTWMIPNFTYAYSYQDASGPSDPADKHKHDFNLGVTFIPFKDTKFSVIPSVQFSHEDFSDGRRDNAWTPTLTTSYQPLAWLAVDLVGSYTDSHSTSAGSSFDALTGTAFIRVFWNW